MIYFIVALCLSAVITKRNFKLFDNEQQSIVSNSHLDSLNLPVKLKQIVSSLRQINDDKLRYQQLLFLATQIPSMPNELKIIENKVNGCLSTVYIHAILQPDNTVYYYGDSDALLTKGLVSILVQGLSNSKVDDILLVEPEFLKYSGLATSLTPGRNNGFLNMLNLMKLKAKELSSTENIVDSSENNKQNNFIIKEDVLLNDNKNINLVKDVESSIESNSINSSDRPIYNSIVKKLSMLKPISLEVIDESYLHANHQAMKELSSSESHFKVIIVASCFNNLTLVQRHKMIYTLLSNELKNGVHALSIVAKTPNE